MVLRSEKIQVGYFRPTRLRKFVRNNDEFFYRVIPKIQREYYYYRIQKSFDLNLKIIPYTLSEIEAIVPSVSMLKIAIASLNSKEYNELVYLKNAILDALILCYEGVTTRDISSGIINFYIQIASHYPLNVFKHYLFFCKVQKHRHRNIDVTKTIMNEIFTKNKSNKKVMKAVSGKKLREKKKKKKKKFERKYQDLSKKKITVVNVSDDVLAYEIFRYLGVYELFRVNGMIYVCKSFCQCCLKSIEGGISKDEEDFLSMIVNSPSNKLFLHLIKVKAFDNEYFIQHLFAYSFKMSFENCLCELVPQIPYNIFEIYLRDYQLLLEINSKKFYSLMTTMLEWIYNTKMNESSIISRAINELIYYSMYFVDKEALKFLAEFKPLKLESIFIFRSSNSLKEIIKTPENYKSFVIEDKKVTLEGMLFFLKCRNIELEYV